MTNRECNLECIKGKKHVPDEGEVVEFVGPVKIILVDQPKHSYRSKVCNAAFIVLAQMSMAITCIIVIFYSLSYEKKYYMKALHVVLCTIGLQLLLPSGVLTMNSLNGAAAPMTLSDRMFEHGMVQIFGLGTTLAGSVVSYFAGYPNIITVHSILGIVANGLAVLNALVGIFLHIFYNLMNKFNSNNYKHINLCIHHTLGILTITISSTCFISGIIEDSFTEWLPLEEILHCLCIFCVFYNCVVIYKPLQLINLV